MKKNKQCISLIILIIAAFIMSGCFLNFPAQYNSSIIANVNDYSIGVDLLDEKLVNIHRMKQMTNPECKAGNIDMFVIFFGS